MSRPLVNAFNAGEFSPELLGRVDLESMKKACRKLRNFVPRVLGGVRRRPAMVRCGAGKFANKKCRLLPFNFSTSARFILELGDGYLRIWKDGVLVKKSPNVTLSLPAVWTEAQLNSIQMVQVNDLVFFTHPDWPVQELRRVTNTNWTLKALKMVWPAMMDENIEATTMQCGVTNVGSTGELDCSESIFSVDHEGGYFQITHRRDSSQVELPLTVTATGGAMRVVGSWEVTSYGTWAGTLFLETKEKDGSWTVLRSWKVAKDDNVLANGKVDVETSMRLRFDHTEHSGDVPPRSVLTAVDPRVNGLVRVTNYVNARKVNIIVVKALHSTASTPIWCEGAWSKKRGYPRACAIHQQRLVLAGSKSEPQKVWGSALNGFNDFQALDFEDASYAVQVAAQEANPIVWLASQEGLIVGTEGDEWLMDSGDGIISPTNPPNVKRKTNFGSADLQSRLVGSVVLFVQRGGRAIREYVFAFDEQGYKAPDLTQLADHLTTGGIVQFAYAQNPDSVIWAVTGDGRLLSCTYQRESEVIAWAQHDTAGQVESVAAIYGANDVDEIYLSVKRTLGGVSSRHIERFDPLHWSKMAQGEAARADLNHFDCSKQFTFSVPTSVVTGLSWLNGQTVAVRADGSQQPARLVTGGQLTLDAPALKVTVGLPYLSKLQPFLFDQPTEFGTSQGLKVRTPEFQARLHLSGAMETADKEDGPFYPYIFRSPMDHSMDAPPPLWSGLTEPIHHQSNLVDGVNLVLQTDSGEPLNILMIVGQTAIYER